MDANNYQSAAEVTRTASVCGLPTTAKLPGCAFAEHALEADDLHVFWNRVELYFQGDHHGLVGGVQDCHFNLKDELATVDEDSVAMRYAADIALFMINYGRLLFSVDSWYLGDYAGATSCPHDDAADACKDAEAEDASVSCTCVLERVLEAVNDGSYDLNYAVHVLAESGFYWDIANAVGFPSINDFAVDDIDDLIATDDATITGLFEGNITADEASILLQVAGKLAAYNPRAINPYRPRRPKARPGMNRGRDADRPWTGRGDAATRIVL